MEFARDSEYREYVYTTVKQGMKVRKLVDGYVKKGDTGVVLRTGMGSSGRHWVNVKWQGYGCECRVWCEDVEIVE